MTMMKKKNNGELNIFEKKKIKKENEKEFEKRKNLKKEKIWKYIIILQVQNLSKNLQDTKC